MSVDVFRMCGSCSRALAPFCAVSFVCFLVVVFFFFFFLGGGVPFIYPFPFMFFLVVWRGDIYKKNSTCIYVTDMS